MIITRDVKANAIHNPVTVWHQLYLKININKLGCIVHFYFLLPISRESIVHGSNFRSGDFDGYTRFEVS